MSAKRKGGRGGGGGNPPSLTVLGKSGVKSPDTPGPGILETFPNPRPGRDYTITLNCLEFTSLCPVTGQPDFATLDIAYTPGERCVESKSLKLYLGAYRNEGSFAETIVNRILDDLVAALDPVSIDVTAKFSPRGGIGIVVEASWPDIDEMMDIDLFDEDDEDLTDLELLDGPDDGER